MRNYQRIKCVLCALLALALTLTGLTVGGVEEAWANDSYDWLTFGSSSHGKFSASDGKLRVISSAPDDADSSGSPIYESVKQNVKTLVIEAKITKLTGFGGLTNLETIVFNSEPELTEGCLAGANGIKTIKLPPKCSAEFESKVKDKFTEIQNIKYEKQYVLHLINVDPNNKPTDSLNTTLTVVNNVSEKTYTTTDFDGENGKITVNIQPKTAPSSKVEFDRWVISETITVSGGSVTGITQTKNDTVATSGAAILTLTKDMPTEVYVTAIYKPKGSEGAVDLNAALAEVKRELVAYSNARELDSVPSNDSEISSGLKSVISTMNAMADGIVKFSMNDFSYVAPSKLPTTSNGVSLSCGFKLKAEDTFNTNAVVTDCALTLKVKQKENTPYTVIVSGGSIDGVSSESGAVSGEFKKTYQLSDIEKASENSLLITLVSKNRSAEHYYFDGWSVQPAGVTLGAISSSEGKQATGTAILNLEEASPQEIYVIAKYKYIQPENTGGGGGTNTGGGGGTNTGGGGAAPSTPTTPEKPKEEEKPKDESKEEDDKKEEDQTKEEDKPAESGSVTNPAKPISKTTKTNKATVSLDDLKKAVENKTNAGMKIKYKDATVTFDAKAVEAIVKQAGKIGNSKLQIVCKPSAQSSLNSAQKKALKNKNVIGCYQIYLKCGNKTISDFGKGKVKVKVPLTLGSGQKSKNVKLYHVDEKGKLTKQSASYSKGYLTFTTTHFSIYAATYPKTTTQVLGKKNETIPGGVVDDSMIGLPAAEEHEEVSFHTLQLHLSRSNDTSVCLGWNLVPGASGYELYGARCNTKTKKYEVIQITTLDAPSMTAWMCDNLKKNTYYKFIVRAYMMYNGEKIYIARSRSAHVSTGGGGYGFIHDVIVDKSAVTLRVGKTSVIKATMDTAGQKIRAHYDLRFESTDPEVATVNNNGKITAKKKGTCTIYVYTQNGLYTTVKVTVQK
ncbi:MAG: Ig-like domain-containing protein [bacterium]|nr:Ig-like domain-containing protein [bacterium]MDY4100518.1 Ig-like domain-containing protein [Lachnospiraceae bacterium]